MVEWQEAGSQRTRTLRPLAVRTRAKKKEKTSQGLTVRDSVRPETEERRKPGKQKEAAKRKQEKRRVVVSRKPREEEGMKCAQP